MFGSRRLGVVAVLAFALGVAACGRSVVLASPIDEAVERAGLHQEAASILGVPQVTREGAERASRDAAAANGHTVDASRTTLVSVTGPGNPRLGWEPRQHPLAYAVERSDGGTVGLTLVSATTGEVLLVTAY